MKVQDVQPKMKTPWYTVLGKQVSDDGRTVWLTIRYPDGGSGVREFDSDTEVPIVSVVRA